MLQSQEVVVPSRRWKLAGKTRILSSSLFVSPQNLVQLSASSFPRHLLVVFSRITLCSPFYSKTFLDLNLSSFSNITGGFSWESGSPLLRNKSSQLVLFHYTHPFLCWFQRLSLLSFPSGKKSLMTLRLIQFLINFL